MIPFSGACHWRYSLLESLQYQLLVIDNVSPFKNKKLLLNMTVSGSYIVIQLFFLAPFLQSIRLLRMAPKAKYSIVTSGDAW
jgi:hypothetical protein